MNDKKKNLPLLTAEQFESVRHLEKHFLTAMRSQWCSYPGRESLENAKALLDSVTGHQHPLSLGCGICMVNLMAELGRIYFATKDSMAAAVVSEAPSTGELKKVEVKTTKGGRRNGKRAN